MHTEISKGHEARLKIKAGIDKACDAVAPTLGAIGMSAVIDFPGLDPVISDDGVTILKNLSFEDKYEDVGLKMLRKGALRTSIEAGDGTATTTVLTQAIVNEAFKEIKDSSKIQEVRQRIEKGLTETIELLKANKKDIDEKDIEQIANISSLDPEIATIIADAIRQIGVNGVLTVEKGSKIGYDSEVVKGARFKSGLISPFFITDHERQEAVLEDCHIVLADRKLSTNEQIMSLLNSIGTGKSILFIADDIDSVALGTLAHNASNKIATIAAVKNPYSASRAQDFLFDMAALTGGTVISESRGMKFNEQDKSVCGMATKVVVTKESTTIIGAYGNEALQERIATIEKQIDETTSEYEKEMLKERLASLTGGIGVIRVGTYTDTDFQAKKYKFDNAINSTQAALQEGIVAGGGIALLDVSIKHSDPIFRGALAASFYQQNKNAGLPVPTFPAGGLEGIDFKTKKVVNMFDAGIVDPFKVQRLALESACAIAMNAIVIETVIVKEDVKKV
jgi:chaperonin GroEL